MSRTPSTERGPHLAGLNPEQARAVRTTEGPLLVLAGAGTGKTRVVISRIAQLLARGVSPGEICAVTFTNKAAKEMRERVHALLKGVDLSDMVVSTFHSLGLRILRDHGGSIGVTRKFGVADQGDQEAILRDALVECGVGRDLLHPRDAKFRISGWKNAGLLPGEALEAALDDLETKLALAYRRYDDELRRRRLLDFDDLILRPLELLDGDEAVRRTLHARWRYLLIDEYQDTNGCQYRLVRHLAAGERNLCVVGDDDQSIYAWRGAEPKRILGFKRDFPEAEVVTLEENYRSTTQILEAANVLIANNTARFEKRLRSNLGSGARLSLYMADDEKDEMDFVASRLLRLSNEEGMPWAAACVLFRANSQCRPLEQALRAREIPYKVVGTRSFFDRREVRDLLAYLRLVRNERDDAAFLRIVNTPPRGIGKGTVDRVAGLAAAGRQPLLVAMREHLDALPARTREGARDLDGLLRKVGETATNAGPGAALELLVAETGYRAHLQQTTDEPLELQKRLAVVDGLLETARDAKGTLAELLDSLSLESEEPRDDRKAEKEDAVTLLTMHAAKGLEFPVVFIIGCEEGIVPHDRTVKEAEDEPSSMGIEEERRLFYVAVTRAKRQLLLTMARRRRRFGTEIEREATRFIEEIGRERMDVTDTGDQTPASEESGRDWLARIRANLRQREADGAPAPTASDAPAGG